MSLLINISMPFSYFELFLEVHQIRQRHYQKAQLYINMKVRMYTFCKPYNFQTFRLPRDYTY